MANVADTVFALVKDTVEAQGVMLWDVRFVKEGASKYLRIYIDKESGVSIDDCSAVSHAVDPILDEADPIPDSYYLEVCSPGTERELIRPEHFIRFAGSNVRVKLYSPVNGSKELTGQLISGGAQLVIDVGGSHLTLKKDEFSKVELSDTSGE